MPAPHTATIALVEDDAVLREELAFQLGHLGFAVETFEDAPQFYRRMAVHRFGVAVLDIGLEGEDGLSICRHLRRHDKRLGIVFVTARALRDDRLLGLDAGADAYLTKPVDIAELNLLLKRLLDRLSVAPAALGAWRIPPDSDHLVAPDGARVRLTMNEMQVLRVLMAKPGDLCGHREFAVALGLLADEYDKHRVEVILSRLRDKVQRETGQTLPVLASRGKGYSFRAG